MMRRNVYVNNRKTLRMATLTVGDYQREEGIDGEDRQPLTQQQVTSDRASQPLPLFKSSRLDVFNPRIKYITLATIVIALILVVWILVDDKEILWFVLCGVLVLILLFLVIFYAERLSRAIRTKTQGLTDSQRSSIGHIRKFYPLYLVISMIALGLVGTAMGMRILNKKKNTKSTSILSVDSILVYAAALILTLQGLGILYGNVAVRYFNDRRNERSLRRY